MVRLEGRREAPQGGGKLGTTPGGDKPRPYKWIIS